MLALLVLLGELCRHGRGLCRRREGASVLAAPLWSSPAVSPSAGGPGRYGPAHWALLVKSARGSQGERELEPLAPGWGSAMALFSVGQKTPRFSRFFQNGSWDSKHGCDIAESVPRQALAPRG